VRYSILLCAVVFCLLAVGCAENRQYFRPTEHVYGQTVHGYEEAIYALVGPFGPFGEAKVWSPGAFRENHATLLHVKLDLHNTSGVPIVVHPDRVHLDPVRAGSQLLHDIKPIEQQPLSIAPGSFGQVHLRFVLPADVRPGEVSAFGLRWQVQNGPQAYSQVTPFLEEAGRFAGAYSPVYGYGFGYFCSPYDPFCARGWYGYPAGPGVIGVPDGGGGRPRAVVRTR
jgi:hypothetical protein